MTLDDGNAGRYLSRAPAAQPLCQMKAWLSWSSGKDSAWAFHRTRDVEIVALLTTVTEAYARVSMHGVRVELLEAQADALGLPLVKVLIPAPCPNEIYETKMREAMDRARSEGVFDVVFGDLFLEDIRAYRESRMTAIGMRCHFPIWKVDTTDLARAMIDAGLKARLVCVDPKQLPRDFAGRSFDASLLRDLPAGVDPCGENGEFHTFAWDGPMFKRPVPIKVGEIVERDGFVFADLLSDREVIKQ